MVTPHHTPVSTIHYTRGPRELRLPAARFPNTPNFLPYQNEGHLLHSYDKRQREREREREREGERERDLNLLNNTSVVMRFVNVVCFLLGNSPASEHYMPTFRNTLFHLHRRVGTYCLCRWNRQSVPKRWHVKFRRRGITQKKAYNIYNKAKV
jgi:hypothetical protein